MLLVFRKYQSWFNISNLSKNKIHLKYGTIRFKIQKDKKFLRFKLVNDLNSINGVNGKFPFNR